MGCFFACFRIRDDRHLPKPPLVSASSRSTDVLISGNRLSSLLPNEEGEDSTQNGSVGSEGDDQGLKDEAKFLKACGTIAGTPAEISKASEKLKVSPSCGNDSAPSRFHSWLPNTSVEKLQLDVQPYDPPTPIKLCQEWGNSKNSLEHTPSSCISNAQDTQHDSPDYMQGSWTGSLHTKDRTEKNAVPVSPWPATDTQRKSKSVRFECDTDLASYGNSSDDWHLKTMKSPNNQSAYKPSPYPTPLKLFDEMQTPGTVYPASFEKLRNGKPRVRSQFVYPIHNPRETSFRRKILEEKDFNIEQDASELSDSAEQAQNATPTPEKGLKEIANGNESKLEASLSSWLKPSSIIMEEGNKGMETAYTQIPHSADRPIIGVVAAHGNEDENSHISPAKWWDVNGIPNSTTKYKEDQKVMWHATPFEERLDKALSEENFISQRKLVCGKPVAFEEIDESDTTLT
ncbi:protein JASON-like [Sesbania bispinosa]|nr:protein JASON-like [Sesbania bispinosa]